MRWTGFCDCADCVHEVARDDEDPTFCNDCYDAGCNLHADDMAPCNCADGFGAYDDDPLTYDSRK